MSLPRGSIEMKNQTKMLHTINSSEWILDDKEGAKITNELSLLDVYSNDEA